MGDPDSRAVLSGWLLSDVLESGTHRNRKSICRQTGGTPWHTGAHTGTHCGTLWLHTGTLWHTLWHRVWHTLCLTHITGGPAPRTIAASNNVLIAQFIYCNMYTSYICACSRYITGTHQIFATFMITILWGKNVFWKTLPEWHFASFELKSTALIKGSHMPERNLRLIFSVDTDVFSDRYRHHHKNHISHP